jgi:hypothetical protein
MNPQTSLITQIRYWQNRVLEGWAPRRGEVGLSDWIKPQERVFGEVEGMIIHGVTVLTGRMCVQEVKDWNKFRRSAGLIVATAETFEHLV